MTHFIVGINDRHGIKLQHYLYLNSVNANSDLVLFEDSYIRTTQYDPHTLTLDIVTI